MEKMKKEELIKKWEDTQIHWDDTEFLATKANALMKKRWQRLNKTVTGIISNEVVANNEYVNMLDIGAGRGDFYKNVQDLIKKYTGIEPSEQMLKNEIMEDDFILKRGTGEELNEGTGFDVVLIKEVLDHCYDPEKVLLNSYNALKEKGIIIITLTNKDSYYKQIFKKRAEKLEEEHKDHLYNFNIKEVSELLAKAGFKIEKVMSTNYLRLPFVIEEIIGRLPAGLVYFILNATDSLARTFLDSKGGSFIIIARK